MRSGSCRRFPGRFAPKISRFSSYRFILISVFFTIPIEIFKILFYLYFSQRNLCAPLLSPPSREAWIEIFKSLIEQQSIVCRLPHGRRGLKFGYSGRQFWIRCRLPHGRRGLKFCFSGADGGNRPRRLPHGRRGLKLDIDKTYELCKASPPSREAWIEINLPCL